VNETPSQASRNSKYSRREQRVANDYKKYDDCKMKKRE
jgi:hypothetical protein